MPGNDLFFQQWEILQIITWVFHEEPNFSYTSELSDGNFELQALNSYINISPRLWLRYVDHTFVIINRT